MKISGLAEALAFRELAGTVGYPPALQLVTDEEVGGRDGTRYQIERGVRGEFVLIGETSGLRIVTESKGMLGVTVRASGRGAHSAYPWLGDNALVKLQRSVHNVLARYPVATEEAWRTTVNLARVHTANQARNQIPAEAEAWLDIRFPPEDTDLAGKSTGQIAAYLQGFCEPGVTAVVDHVDAPQNADGGRPEITRLAGAALAQGYQPEFLRKHGTGDGRFYGEAGVTAVAFGVGGHGQHGAEEYADIATIGPYYQALTQFLRIRGPGSLRQGQRAEGLADGRDALRVPLAAGSGSRNASAMLVRPIASSDQSPSAPNGFPWACGPASSGRDNAVMIKPRMVALSSVASTANVAPGRSRYPNRAAICSQAAATWAVCSRSDLARISWTSLRSRRRRGSRRSRAAPGRSATRATGTASRSPAVTAGGTFPAAAVPPVRGLEPVQPLGHDLPDQVQLVAGNGERRRVPGQFLHQVA